ncbi:MAG: ester cyclase [Hyphomonadaceae bacterium]|nr:ester cyclase [Hyphomonadaceae bacterium]
MTDRRAFLNGAVAMGAGAGAAAALAPQPAEASARRTLQIARDYVVGFLGAPDVRGAGLAMADRVLSPDIVVTTGLSPTGPIRGLAAYKEVFLGFRDAFPHEDAMQIIDSFATRDRAVIRFHIRQRHARDYFGVAATNRVILFDETHVMTVRDGKVVENVVSATNLEFEMLMAPVLTPLILR